MKITVCITTMNRPKELGLCLDALWNSSYLPYAVVVSDNSVDPEIQRQTEDVVHQYPKSIYREGPHTGVTHNRNNALNAVPSETDRVLFLADDICVEPDFFERAIAHYEALPVQEREKTILYGQNRDEYSPPEIGPLGVSFRGYFCKWKKGIPQIVNLYTALFPRAFLDKERWDEQIFLGQEDIELSLRALSQGYKIVYHSDMKVFDLCLKQNKGVTTFKVGPLNQYEIYVAASRLYVGIKRYKHLFPNAFKLILFQVIFYSHMTIYLLRRRALSSWPAILKESKIRTL